MMDNSVEFELIMQRCIPSIAH